jgi:hypothetical protein
MALGSTQPLTEMSTRNISWWGKGGWCVELKTVPIFLKSGRRRLNFLGPSGPVQSCNGFALPFKVLKIVFNYFYIFFDISNDGEKLFEKP